MSSKFCPKNHSLLSCTWSNNGVQPSCNSCLIPALLSSYSCKPCNYHRCPSCYGVSTGNNFNNNFNVNVNVQPTTNYVGTARTCLNKHALTYTTQRFNPTCNGCSAQKLPYSYACFACNYDLCDLCYKGSYGNINLNTNTTYIPTYNNNTGFNNNTNFVPNYNNNQVINTNTNFVPNYNNNQVINTNTNFVPNYNNQVINTNTNFVPNYNNQGFNSNSNVIPNSGFNNVPNYNNNQGFSNTTIYNPSYPNTNINTNYNSNSGTGYVPNYNNNSNFNYNSGGGSTTNYNFNTSTNMIPQTNAIEFKQCPSKHYLTLCDSGTRPYPTCNVCNRTSLQHSWTCFPCNYDMCLECYDRDNTRPTNKVKVCNKRHLLCYTDKYSRPNVSCDKCKSSGFFNQYTCWVCNYDECMTCYEGRSGNNCVIF